MEEIRDMTMPRAVLAGLNTGDDRENYARSMEELAELAGAAGVEPVSTCVQHAPAMTKRSYLGSGKVEELKMEILASDADLVIFNESLTPMQQKNLEEDLDTEVLDRTGLILRIFASRARTREAKLQVESAQLQYLLPRLAGLRVGLSRQGGGSGRLSNKGAGEEQIELDRRHIEQRIAELRRQLSAVERERSTQRARRVSSGLPRVALVGYTNVGKSTLMNALLSLSDETQEPQKAVLEKDMLFATLDTSVRRIHDGVHPDFLLSDTVGFVRDLPHSLVKAFRSTLEEACSADLLLIVADASDPERDHQIKVTLDTLSDLDARSIPVLVVYNKCDKLPPEAPIDYPRQIGDKIYLSAREPKSIAFLAGAIDEALSKGLRETELTIPYDKGALLSDLLDRYPILETEYLPEGTRIKLKLRPADLGRIESALGR